jgi:outer membrane protein assembly factor BamD
MVNSTGRLTAIVSLCLAVSFLAGCASPDNELGAEIRKTLGVTKDTLEKTENSAERNYDPEVILKRAEAYFKQKDYIEAGGEFQRFLDLHPLHEWADYALFRLGMTHFLQFKTIDRDTEPARKALETFQRLLAVYPDVEYAEEATKKMEECRRILAENQLYIGRFYYKKGAYPSAIQRLTLLLDRYGDLPPAEEGLYFLGMSHYYNHNPVEALQHLQDWLARYPEAERRRSVIRVVDRLRRTTQP